MLGGANCILVDMLAFRGEDVIANHRYYPSVLYVASCEVVDEPLTFFLSLRCGRSVLVRYAVTVGGDPFLLPTMGGQ